MEVHIVEEIVVKKCAICQILLDVVVHHVLAQINQGDYIKLWKLYNRSPFHRGLGEAPPIILPLPNGWKLYYDQNKVPYYHKSEDNITTTRYIYIYI